MKINRIEEEIIKSFVIKNRQERILWELESPKKRNLVFWHFAGINLLKKECLNPIKYMAIDELEIYLSKYLNKKDVYYIGSDFIGEISLKESIKNIAFGDICIVYLGNGIAYYQGEEEFGNRPIYLLKSI